MYGSYSAVAAWLTGLYGRTVTRQQVYTWSIRGTRNKAGEPFPEPVETVPAKARQPRRKFSLAAVAGWYKAGVPADGGGKVWIMPGE